MENVGMEKEVTGKNGENRKKGEKGKGKRKVREKGGREEGAKGGKGKGRKK